MHGTTVLAAAHDDLQIHALELEQIHALISDDSADEVKQLFREMEAEENVLDDELPVESSSDDDEAPAVVETSSASQDPLGAVSETSVPLEEKLVEDKLHTAEGTLGPSSEDVTTEASTDVEVVSERSDSAPRVAVETPSNEAKHAVEVPSKEVLSSDEETNGALAASGFSVGEDSVVLSASGVHLGPSEAAAAIDDQDNTTVARPKQTPLQETPALSDSAKASAAGSSDGASENDSASIESILVTVSEPVDVAKTGGATSNKVLGAEVEAGVSDNAEQSSGDMAAKDTVVDHISSESKANEDTAMAKAAATITIPGLVESEAEVEALEGSTASKVVAAEELLLNVSDIQSSTDTKLESQSAVGSLLPSRLKALGRFMSGHTQSSDPNPAALADEANKNAANMPNKTNATVETMSRTVVSPDAADSLPSVDTHSHDSDKDDSVAVNAAETSAASLEASADETRAEAPIPLDEAPLTAVVESTVDLSLEQKSEQTVGTAATNNTTVALEASPLLDATSAKTTIELPSMNQEEALATKDIASKINEGVPTKLNESSRREEEEAKSCVGEGSANLEEEKPFEAGASSGITADVTSATNLASVPSTRSDVDATFTSSDISIENFAIEASTLNSTSAGTGPLNPVADSKESMSSNSITSTVAAPLNASDAILLVANAADTTIIAPPATDTISNVTPSTISATTTVSTNMVLPPTPNKSMEPAALPNMNNPTIAAAIKATDPAGVVNKTADASPNPNKTTFAAAVPHKNNATTAVPNKTTAPAKVPPSNGDKASLDKKLDKCMEGLNFTKFKEKVQAKVAAAKAAAHGANGVGAAAAASLQQDRIFKTMMDMIKTVEINSSILELYLVKLHTCYSSVLEDAKQERDAALLAMRQDLEQHTPAGHTLHREMAAVELRVAAAEQNGWSLLMVAGAACTMALLLSVAACTLVLRQRLELKALRQPVSPQRSLEQPQPAFNRPALSSSQADSYMVPHTGAGHLAASPSPRLEVPNSDRIPPEMEGSISTKPKHLSATETSTGAPFLPCAPVSEQKKQTRGGPGYG